MNKEPWREVRKITKPTLVIQGSIDEHCYGRVKDCVSLIKTAVNGYKNFKFEIIEGADHSFFGKRKELVEKSLNFLLD
jgi:alpha/beta superfamily hydrolase